MKIRVANDFINTIGFLETNYIASNNIEANPELDAATWTPILTSPAIDNGTPVDIVQTALQNFQLRYGIDISQDIYGTARPQGNGWDIGAIEALE